MSSSLSHLLLGSEEKQRRRLRIFFAASFMYIASTGMAFYAAWIGVWQMWQAQVDVAYLLSGWALSYVLLRGPWSHRLTDPFVLMTQIGFAVSATDFAYALGGEARAALLVIFGMHIVFMMLTLSPRQTLRLGTATMLSFALTSGLMAWWKPQAFPWKLELLHVGIAMSILPIMLQAAIWVSKLRRTEAQQNEQLTQMAAKLEVLAQHDELTGLFNRRHMMELLAMECRRAQRSGAPMSLAMIDLDHFKRINDTLGHQVGDRVLQVFAQAAGLKLRSSDVLARWGGEEFLLLMPETRAVDAINVIARVRQELDQVGFQVDGRAVPVTFSAGLAQWVKDESTDQFLERADRALYRAKHQGRNRTEFVETTV